MGSRSTVITVAFFGALLTVVAGVLLELASLVLPEGLAARIGRNSEGLVLALLLAGWIGFARPALAGRPGQWRPTVLAAAGCLAVGVALLLSDLPSRFRTLNESFLAAALLLPYLQARRPLPPRLAAGLSLAVLVLVVAFNRTGAVTGLAESLGVLLLAPIAFDLVDRQILDPSARVARGLRAGWYAFLIVTPVVLSLLQGRLDPGGLAGEGLRYGARLTEAFVCLLLVELSLTSGVRGTGHRTTAGTAPGPAATSPAR